MPKINATVVAQPKQPRKGAKQRLREYLVDNVGKTLESRDLQRIAGGAVQYDRRLRELREDEGWPILSHNDTSKLKPGQYTLAELPPNKPIRFTRGISRKIRAEVLDRNGFTCQMCGLTPGDIDAASGRKVRLHIGHVKDKNLGGKEELSNLRTLCSACNQGAKNVTGEKPGTIWLLSQIRRAGQDEQKAVLIWLQKKFK